VDYPAVVPSDAAGVADLLVEGLAGDRLLGIELEMGLLRREDLRPPSYEEAGGVGALLQRLIREQDYEPVYEGEHVIALDRADGNAITLEPGGQTEIATKPWTSLVDLDRGMKEKLRPLAEAVAAEGLYLIGGSLALTPQDAAPWMPKARYALMRAHFEALGEAGRLAWVMMQRSLSTQVSLDYADDPDGAELLRLGFLLAPIATAIFANSPFDGWEESGFLSYRAEVWRYTDPARSGDVEACMKPGASLVDWVDYVLDAPPMFRIRGGEYVAPGTGSFREVFSERRWPDGSTLSLQDVWNHANGVFPNARAKRGMVELRSTDGQRFQDLAQIPAFWTGLFYDAESRAAVLDLLGDVSFADHQATQVEVPKKALGARWGERPLAEVAREVVALAKAGLGRFEPEAVPLLEPVERRVAAGTCPAEELLAAWRGELGGDRRKLAEHLAFSL
jgi:glutamate--cysteine ligase